MLCLSQDWDGFGTGPIHKNVYNTGKKFIESLNRSDVVGVRIFVGVNMPGSLFVEIIQIGRRIEITINTDGTIFFDEFLAGVHCGAGMFVLTADKLDELLRY
jgi:hypothetical protein